MAGKEDRKRDRDALVSRVVQAGFLAALVLIWYLASTRWGVNRLLLPNPVAVYDNLIDILRSGEFIEDLETTLGELAAAFAISLATTNARAEIASATAMVAPDLPRMTANLSHEIVCVRD